MARYMELYIGQVRSLEELVNITEQLLDVRFDFNKDDDYTWYTFENDKISLSIQNHDFEDNRDMHFTGYPYYISMRGMQADGSKRLEYQRHFAQFLYSKFRHLRKYNLMLTDDGQTKLDEFKIDTFNLE